MVVLVNVSVRKIKRMFLPCPLLFCFPMLFFFPQPSWFAIVPPCFFGLSLRPLVPSLTALLVVGVVVPISPLCFRMVSGLSPCPGSIASSSVGDRPCGLRLFPLFSRALCFLMVWSLVSSRVNWFCCSRLCWWWAL